MNSDSEREAVSFVSGLILGAIIGAGVAMLTAPQPGRKTRKRIKKSAKRLRGTATDRLDDLAGEIKDKVDEAVVAARTRLPTA
ncbi:MAG: YtxH domain-containing protein [Longimicrobiales bacterium]|nr:YtxH domain-containing protein [Longimicrobiales bacterium]